MKKQPPRIWHNPDPTALGDIVSEKIADDQKSKATIIRNKQGNFTVYLYRYDDSDVKEGWTNAAGWLGVIGPSVTDSIDKAERLALEYLDAGKDKKE